MKKFILLTVFIGLALTSYSQRFHGGIHGGFIASQLDGDNLGGYNKAGLRGGGWVNTKISSLLTLQMELEYIQKGSKISESELLAGGYYHSLLSYIQLPILARIQATENITGEGGIAGGYLFEGLEDKDGTTFMDADPPFDEYELSLLIGLNYHFNENLTGNIRFNYSALPIREHPGGQVYWLDRGQYNNVLSFGIYYEFVY
ncbi:MAG: outer membrane beta-barrel protein [Bacteroidales bacterium]